MGTPPAEHTGRKPCKRYFSRTRKLSRSRADPEISCIASARRPNGIHESVCSYRMWITMNKLPYAPLQYLDIEPDIHQAERLCGGLPPSVLRVSEKNSSRKLAEQACLPTPRYLIGMRAYDCRFPRKSLSAIEWIEAIARPLFLCVNSFGHPGYRGLSRNSAFAGDLFPHETYDASKIEAESIGDAIAKEGGSVQRIILKRLVTVAALVLAMVLAIAIPTFAQILP